MYLAKDVRFVLREMALAVARWVRRRWLKGGGCPSRAVRVSWGDGVCWKAFLVRVPKDVEKSSQVPFPVGGGAWAAGW